MRYRIRHRTAYSYADAVTLSQNIARLAPREAPGQQVASHRLEIDPAPAAVRRCPDYFGNATHSFAIASPHAHLVVVSLAEVAVAVPGRCDAASTPAWDAAAVQGGGGERSAWEFRYDSPQIPCAAPLRAFAVPDFPAGRPVLEAALALNRRIHREFAYDPAATNVTTAVLDALELRRGVCQDFAQVLIGSLRTLGLAARYVSGYLETIPQPGRPRLVGADATHAWAQVWCGPDAGWIDLDPTNDCIPADRHIRVAWGRDFTDVSPLKGMVLGGGKAEVKVGVDVERIG